MVGDPGVAVEWVGVRWKVKSRLKLGFRHSLICAFLQPGAEGRKRTNDVVKKILNSARNIPSLERAERHGGL